MDFPAINQSGPTTPTTGPSALTPQPQPGLEAQALIKVRQASMLLAEAVGMLKTRLSTDLGKAALGALKMLAPQTPGIEEGLGQSELASMTAGLLPVRPAPSAGGVPNWMGKKPPVAQRIAGPPIGGTAGPVPARAA